MDSTTLDAKGRRVTISATKEFALELDGDAENSTSDINPNDEAEIGEDGERHHHRHHKGRFKLWRRRLFALGWTYLLISYRRMPSTILQTIVPVIILAIFVLSISYHFHWELSGRAKVELTKDAQESIYTDGTDTTKLRKYFLENEFICHKHGGETLGEANIIYAPKNDFTESFIARIIENLGIVGHGHGVDSEAELVQRCKDLFRRRVLNPTTSEPAPIGLIFKIGEKIASDNGPYTVSDYLSHTFSYTIRTFLPEVANTQELFAYYKALKKEQNLSPYIGSGFLGFQNAIDFAYMRIVAEIQAQENHPDALKTKDTVDQTLRKFKVKMFPFPVYLDTKARTSTWFLLVLALVLGSFFTTYIQSKKIIQDKKSGILELLQLHGLSTTVNWISVLMQDIVSRAIQAGLLTVILVGGLTSPAFIQYSSPGQLWFVLYLHGFPQASFHHVTSLLFSSTTFGAIISCFIGFLTFIAPMTLYVIGFNFGKIFNALLCFLFPNWCLANALYNFLKFESYDSGVNMSLFARFADERRIIISEAICIITFFLSTITYFLLTVYIDKVQEKQFIPSESYFYWLKRKSQDGGEDEDDDVVEAEFGDDDFEKPLVYEGVADRKVSIKCRRVSHVVGGILQVLDNVNFNVYEGELTLLLGNNGSGKSTLIRCLGGIMKPDNGYALFSGIPIFGNMEIIQEHFGFCFKSHLFYSHLTVEEHILLCCMLHGNEYMITKRQCVALMIRLKLYNVRNCSTKTLSEAQKRKLSIAMALANNPKILILDHPTTRMDSSEVHEIWSILKGLRNKRTIIATANTMEEADLHAERIGMMANGRLLSFSSANFLKMTLNAGSYVKVDKAENMALNVGGIISTIGKTAGSNEVEHVQMKAFEHHDAQAYFSIPAKTQLSKILQSLESNQEELGISKIGVMHMTLANVLQYLTNLAGIAQDNIGAFVIHDADNPYQSIRLPVEIPKFPSDCPKAPNFLTTTTALFIKQVLFIRQKHRFYWIEHLFPLIMAFLIVYFSEFYIWSQPIDKSLQLSVNTYSMPSVPVFLENVAGRLESESYKKGLLSIIGDRADRLVLFGDVLSDRGKFQEVLKPSEVSMLDYRAQVVVALSNEHDNTAYYASNALHSAPAAHNFLTNLLLYSFTDDVRKDTNPYRIDAYNHPLPQLEEEQGSGTTGDVTNAAVGCILSLVLALIAASKIALPLRDRITGCQSLQFVAGVEPAQYWIVMAVCDAIFNFSIAILLMGVICISDLASKNAFHGVESKLTLMTVICAYLCCSNLPYGYILSKLMSSQFSAYGQYIIIHIMLGILPQLATFILFYELPIGVRATLEGIFSILPPYTMTGALVRYVHLAVEQSYCLKTPLDVQELCLIYDKLPNQDSIITMTGSDPYFRTCCQKFCKPAGTCYENPPFLIQNFELPLNLASCIYVMLIQGLAYLLVLLIIEYKMVQWIWGIIQLRIAGDVEAARLHLLREVEADNTNEESVQKEVERIEAIAEAGGNHSEEILDIFYARNITKWFRKKEILSHIYFGAPRGSVLGIMGAANSGKSTLARIIVGDVRTNLGYCVIEPGLRIDKAKKQYLQMIGYCSQHESPLQFLTGFQMMQLIGRIRGLPASYLDIHCRKWLELFRFSDQEMTTITAHYDLGLQRRLCCAMAFLGNCEIIVLDEPTTGFDVISHQNFWSIAQLVKLNGQCIIFNSISAQECIENSNKMILMEDGKMKAIGTPNAISEQYATGWTLIVRFRTDFGTKYSKNEVSEKQALIKDNIQGMYRPCELKDADGNLLIYHVKENQKPLSEMYSIMEVIQSDLSEFISDYHIEESSLDDIMGYFGGSANRRNKLTSFSNDGDSGSGSLELPEGAGFSEMSEENQMKWLDLKKHQYSHSSPQNSLNDFNLDFVNVVRKNMLVRKPIEKVKETRAKSLGGGLLDPGQKPRQSMFTQKLTRNENIFNFLQQRTAEAEKQNNPTHHSSHRIRKSVVH